MDPELLEELKSGIKGDVETDDATLTKYSHDASIYELRPQVVVFPKDETDVRFLVNFVNSHKKEHISKFIKYYFFCIEIFDIEKLFM